MSDESTREKVAAAVEEWDSMPKPKKAAMTASDDDSIPDDIELDKLEATLKAHEMTGYGEFIKELNLCEPPTVSEFYSPPRLTAAWAGSPRRGRRR